MTITSHILGYPRIGDKRQTKLALENYWKGKQERTVVLNQIQAVFDTNISDQIDADLSVITTGDFAHYDLVLTQAVALGVLPSRFVGAGKLDSFDRQFYFARGRDSTGQCADTAAWQMTKWFDTNYHYLVPELKADECFDHLDFTQIIKQVTDTQAILSAKGVDKPIKVVLIGPVSFLYLSTSELDDKTAHLDKLIPAYTKLLAELGELGVAYAQLDEPILSLDLDGRWQQAFERAYTSLQRIPPKLIIASYFDTLGNNLHTACNLPVFGLHIDVTRAKNPKYYLTQVIDQLPTHKILSVGVVDGRSVWTTNQGAAQDLLSDAYDKLGERLWVGSGSSLLHLPVDVAHEHVPSHLQGKLAFAKQKLSEVVICAQLATGEKKADDNATTFDLNITVAAPQVRTGEFKTRYAKQNAKLKLPLFPTTTIGSFPQTDEIRKARAAWKKGNLSDADYTFAMQDEIRRCVESQEKLGLDVLVHGEAERTDMVEYFANYMDGFWVSANGWVQSYGTRCVRPPIVVGNISRPKPMTVEWIKYAQSLTNKPMKGMLTGPVTILNWSFAPSDTALRDVLRLQIAEAINQEVRDLQEAGIDIIQIDEPAFREGLPLKQADHAHYWKQAVTAFRHSCSCADETTQIHTHMCYSSFHDCLGHIADMDADVITIETARSGLQLLEAFKEGSYHNAMGLGVYDIHSPRTPTDEQMQVVIDKALAYVPKERLWINPDCGLKTRNWQETLSALANMVQMSQVVREKYAK
ncbi:MAG: 5-methyltetrahydropteroyltriglutamate--homocysteine S-methyltransferase [Moraxella sp.]|nr:5-methyltetrahydropteroyltriglutamate--homocysteine S-methyltransferase [Moraxella sp.]